MGGLCVKIFEEKGSKEAEDYTRKVSGYQE